MSKGAPRHTTMHGHVYAGSTPTWRRPWTYWPWRGLAQVPNLLSVARLIATPVIVGMLLWVPPNRLVAAVIFCLASLTDYLDGYLARRWQVVSQFGVFCDLMADKLLVAATLIALVGIDQVPSWMVIVIVGRELVISGLRSWAAAQGVVIPAGSWGKGKTLLTLIAIAVTIVNWWPTASFILLLGATLLTLISALDYIYQAWRIGSG
ncbi:MAG TPA: CDP-diacylglycerol--glycerol-3-phosphate 3-phosphatidyltransferase [Chloroflexota bacterium]|nr:CDP-diacylglycerol--glycerol-3-phosphate 3-phosphatidyltransferase [Chloroflexota bacterium]